MKRNRLIWAACLILSLIAISFYGGEISYGFFFAVVFVPVISFVYLLAVYFTFKIYQKTEQTGLMAKTPVPFYFTLQNEGFFVFAGIRVHFFSDFSNIQGEDLHKESVIYSGEGIKSETVLFCKYSGEYEIGINRVEIRDFFNLFRLTYKNPETLRVNVGPKPVFLSSLRSEEESDSSKENTVDKSVLDVFTREYVAGDDVRHINWKKSGESGKLLVRNMTGEEKTGVGVLLLSKRISDEMTDYLPLESRMLEAALGVMLFYLQKNSAVSFYRFKSEAEAFTYSGLSDYETLYSDVSGVSFDKDFDYQTALSKLCRIADVFNKKVFYIFTQDLSEEMSAFVKMLNEEDVSVYIYLVGNFNTTGEEKINSKTVLIKIPCEGFLEEVL